MATPSYDERLARQLRLEAAVKMLRATDATAKNPMQATDSDATATPTDVLLGLRIQTAQISIAVKTYVMVTDNNCQ